MADDEGSPQQVLWRLLGRADPSALAAFCNVAVAPTEIEDFCPLEECLEWRLAGACWHRSGVIPFVRNDVPYLVNNSGRLSRNVAALVHTACAELGSSLPERLVILELGAGLGLFARLFLDAFVNECRSASSDFYDRLTYVVTDRFEGTVTGWSRDRIFAGHEEHVVSGVCDATSPARLLLSDGTVSAPSDPPFVVICNYVLDVLPSAIVRRTATGLEHLCVRTHLTGGDKPLRAAGLTSFAQARTLASSDRLEDLVRLLPLQGYMEIETAYRPWQPSRATDAELGACIPEGQRSIVNGGALACLDEVLAMLAPGGFIVVNDYGPVFANEIDDHIGVQRYGNTVAAGLNFPALERALASRRVHCLAGQGDDKRRVHTRLLAREVGMKTRELLDQRFSGVAERELDSPQDDARRHVAAGRRNEAIESYRRMIASNPGDWQMLGEAADYIGLQLGDHASALPIVHAALAQNPWYSNWLWNILGDCLFCRERLGEAHDAFLQALRVDPDDPRTNLNLAYTFSARGDLVAAMAAVARGLAHDERGLYRARLLEKQSQILSLISERVAAEQARLAKRTERFR